MIYLEQKNKIVSWRLSKRNISLLPENLRKNKLRNRYIVHFIIIVFRFDLSKQAKLEYHEDIEHGDKYRLN